MSIAYDNPRILSEKEVFKLIYNYEPPKIISKSNFLKLETKRIYTLGENYISATRTIAQSQQIPMYEVGINDGKNNGIAIVAADERVAGILAYIPQITTDQEKAKKERENNLMLEFAELNLMAHLTYVDSIRLIMRDTTIKKISTKLGIPKDKLLFAEIKDKIEIKQIPTKAYTGVPLRINLDVDWGQNEPYNLLLKTYTDPDFPWITNHYPLGCAVTALMMVYSYFEPHMNGYDNGEPMTIDWKYLKENRQIVNPDYGIPGDPEKRIRMISRLGLWVYNGTKTVTTPDGNGWYRNPFNEHATGDKRPIQVNLQFLYFTPF